MLPCLNEGKGKAKKRLSFGVHRGTQFQSGDLCICLYYSMCTEREMLFPTPVKALTLAGPTKGEPSTRPPSCTTPQQPTIYAHTCRIQIQPSLARTYLKPKT